MSLSLVLVFPVVTASRIRNRHCHKSGSTRTRVNSTPPAVHDLDGGDATFASSSANSFRSIWRVRSSVISASRLLYRARFSVWMNLSIALLFKIGREHNTLCHRRMPRSGPVITYIAMSGTGHKGQTLLDLGQCDLGSWPLASVRALAERHEGAVPVFVRGSDYPHPGLALFHRSGDPNRSQPPASLPRA